MRNILNSIDFTCQFRNNQTKVYTNCEEHRHSVIRELEKEKVDFHTYTRREDKIKKIVLKAAPGLDLKEELEFDGIDVVNIINLRSRAENVESHSYQVCVKKETNLRDIYKIKGAQNTRVKWATYAKKNKITQCYRCQQFGHSQANCHEEPK